ncbi:MAG: hypothetical protein HMLKMBBP_01716 [Planctomycetes bacterium]|nr:hypothetical protein [Planctomycetota bacterium]
MTGRLRAFAAVLAAALLAAGSRATARAEDAPAEWTLKAVDYSQRFGSDDEKAEHLLRNAKVTVLATGEGAPAPFEVTTGDDGKFTVPPAAATAASVQFLVPEPDGSRWPRYVTQAIRPGEGPRPDVAAFLRVAAESPLYAEQVMQPIVAVDRDRPNPYVRLRWIALIQNQTPEVWFGNRAQPDRGTLQVPLPDGFEVLGVTLAGSNPPHTIGDAPGGGREIRISGPVYPSFRGPDQLEITLTGPWRDGGEWDLSFAAPLPIATYILVAEEGAFTVDPGTSLQGGERQAALEDRIAPTVMWTASEIPAGTVLSFRVLQGHRVDWRVWITVGILALALTGGVLLGRAAGSGRADAASDAAGAERSLASALDAEVAELNARRKRGEITEFEAAARIAALRKSAAAADGPEDEVSAIAARAAKASPEQLRRDVARLVDLIREARRS